MEGWQGFLDSMAFFSTAVTKGIAGWHKMASVFAATMQLGLPAPIGWALHGLCAGVGHAIALYPNPSSDVLHIQMPSSMSLEKVIIYNNLGQKVIENSSLDFSITALATGIHYIDIQTTNGTFHKKFIKE